MARLSLKGDWAVVTGASTGIGRELARQLSAQGAKLIVVARRRPALEELAQSLPTQCEVVDADLSNEQGLARLFAVVEERGLKVAHVINNAGFGSVGRFAEMAEVDLVGQIQLNCVALTRVTRHFLPQMLARGRGGLMQVSSVVSYVPTPFMAAYSATKAYVTSLCMAMGPELKGTGVHCTALCPGPVATGFQERARYEISAMERGNQLPVQEVARQAIEGYLRRKPVVVPGARNSLMCWMSRHVPEGFASSVARTVMLRAGRDKPLPRLGT